MNAQETLSFQRGMNLLISRELISIPRLDPDGVLGNKTKGAQLNAYNFIQNEYKKRQWLSKIDSLEYCSFRLSKKYTNHFSDVAAIWYPDKPENTILLPMSTVPGFYGKGAIMQPRSVVTRKFPQGFSGTAVLCPDRYVETWELLNDGWSGNPYLMQRNGVRIGRDGDKDLDIDWQVEEIDFNAQVTGKLGTEFGINHHGYNDYDVDVVNNISLGCQVYMKTYLKIVIPYWVLLGKLKPSKKITYSLMEV